MQRVSPMLPLLSGTGCSVYLLTSNTESFDEDDEEVGVDVVEELVDEPGSTNSIQLVFFAINSFAIFFFGEMWFLTAGPVVGTHDPCRASQEKELREFLQEA